MATRNTVLDNESIAFTEIIDHCANKHGVPAGRASAGGRAHSKRRRPQGGERESLGLRHNVPRALISNNGAWKGWPSGDMQTFQPGTPGGGGVSLSLQLFTEACVRLLPEGVVEDVIQSDRPLVIRHGLTGLRRLLYLDATDVHFEVHTYPGFDTHSGLGSTSSAVIAALAGANECLGWPLELDAIRLLASYNFVEEDDEQPGSIKFGWETGMTGMGACGGGLFLLSRALVLLRRFPDFAAGKAVYIVLPNKKKQAMHIQEDHLLQQGALSDERVGHKKAHAILMDIAPAAAAGNVAQVGDVVWEMQTAGSKVEEIKAFPGLLDFMQEARASLQPELLAMSSVGPATLLIADPARGLKGAVGQLAGRHDCALRYVTGVDNVGLRSLPPKLVFVLGPPGAGKSTLCQALQERLGGIVKWVSVSGLIKSFVASNPGTQAAMALHQVQATGGVADYKETTTHLVLRQIFELQCVAATSRQPGAPISAPLVVLLDGFPRTVSQALAFERLSGMLAVRRGCQAAEGGRSMSAAAPRLAKVVMLQCGSGMAHHRMVARAREAAGTLAAAAARLGRDETQAVLLYIRSQPAEYALLEVNAEEGVERVVAQVLQGLGQH